MDFPAWDPVLFDIPGLPIDIRWYGMMYVVGFLVGQFVFVRLARRGFFPVAPEVAPDLIFYLVFGVMLGGRTGYALFYDHALLNPIQFVQVWKGGLAFHGGLVGVAVACWLFCRRYKVGWGRTADSCALAVCPGIFAVRCANFINGELFGRPCDKGVGWAMQFPTDPKAEQLLGLSDAWTMRDRELCIQVAYGHRKFEDIQHLLSTVDADNHKIDWASVVPNLDWEKWRHQTDFDGHLTVPYRHPSQLYEGICEGLVLGILLLIVYLATRNRPLPPGRYAAIFLLGYAVARWSLELVRQWDPQLPQNVMLGMTMGQTLSVGLVVFAAGILLWPRRAGSSASS